MEVDDAPTEPDLVLEPSTAPAVEPSDAASAIAAEVVRQLRDSGILVAKTGISSRRRKERTWLDDEKDNECSDPTESREDTGSLRLAQMASELVSGWRRKRKRSG
jgi:hypothetical protein